MNQDKQDRFYRKPFPRYYQQYRDNYDYPMRNNNNFQPRD